MCATKCASLALRSRADEKDPQKRLYPGGPFDPAGFSKDANNLKSLKQKELANGRLAMLAFHGLTVQWVATGTGPIANLTSHLVRPSGCPAPLLIDGCRSRGK